MNDSHPLHLEGLDDILVDIERKEAAAKAAKDALATAETAHKALEHDDGTLDPVVLVDRRMEAHRALELARIEAGRAETAAESLRSRHKFDLLKKCEEAGRRLTALASERENQVVGLIRSVLQPDTHEQTLNREIANILRYATGVADRKRAASGLASYSSGFGPSNPKVSDLINHLKQIRPLLEPNPSIQP